MVANWRLPPVGLPHDAAESFLGSSLTGPRWFEPPPRLICAAFEDLGGPLGAVAAAAVITTARATSSELLDEQGDSQVAATSADATIEPAVLADEVPSPQRSLGEEMEHEEPVADVWQVVGAESCTKEPVAGATCPGSGRLGAVAVEKEFEIVRCRRRLCCCCCLDERSSTWLGWLEVKLDAETTDDDDDDELSSVLDEPLA